MKMHYIKINIKATREKRQIALKGVIIMVIRLTVDVSSAIMDSRN